MGDAGNMSSSTMPAGKLLEQADAAMARGEIREAATLLEMAAKSGPDAAVLFRLATVRRALGDFPGATSAAENALQLNPQDFLAALLLGSLRELTGAIHAAERAYRVACANAPPGSSLQPSIRTKLGEAQQVVDMMAGWKQRLLDWQPEGPLTKLSQQELDRAQQFRANILEDFEAGPVAPPLFLYPGIEPKGFFDPADFGGAAEIAAETDGIREEFLSLAEHMSADFASRLGGLHSAEEPDRQGKWSMIPLMRNGAVVEAFASRCPLTMKLASGVEMPKIGLISPSLYFSVLEPNSRIAPHKGITTTRLIAHWPLIVPDDCAFKVAGEVRPWEPGTPMIFDDMSVHEAWNDSDRIRVVLIADYWRPELSPLERIAVTDLMDCTGGSRAS
jgi:hypothetical protein